MRHSFVSEDEVLSFKCTRCKRKIKKEDIHLHINEADQVEEYHKSCHEKQEFIRQGQAKYEDKKLKEKQETHPPQEIEKIWTRENETNEALRSEILMALVVSKPKATELLNQYILQNNHIYTTRHDEKPEVWIYQEGIYAPNGKTHIREIIRDLSGNLFSSHLINDVIRKVETDTYINQNEFFSKGEEDPHLLPVQNGILNINTRELIPFTHKQFFFSKLPITYDPKAECPQIKKFISQITRAGDTPTLQEFSGFCLLREYKYERSLMLYGDGRNGKGKFLVLLKSLLGIENVSNVSLQDMEKDQFAIGELHGKLGNIAGDISSAAIKNSGNFKNLTGRDMVNPPRKFLTRIKFVNYAKMIFAANIIPRTTDMSLAFFDRWILIEFPYTFLTQDKIDALPKDERKNIKLRNPQIIEDITSETELNGFLNWVLDGYDRLRKNDGFSDANTTDDIRRKWIQKSDSFLSFCLENVEESYEDEILKTEVRHEYQQYCRRNKVKGVSDKVIKYTLAENFGASERRSDSDYYWVGIKFTRKNQESGRNREGGYGISTSSKFAKNGKSQKTIPKLPTLPDTDTTEQEVKQERIDIK